MALHGLQLKSYRPDASVPGVRVRRNRHSRTSSRLAPDMKQAPAV